jgi:hypothetical protein
MATQSPHPDAREQDPRDLDVEADAVDLAEQRRDVTGADEPDVPSADTPRVLDEEADEADLLEQEREVGGDDEDYRPA